MREVREDEDRKELCAGVRDLTCLANQLGFDRADIRVQTDDLMELHREVQRVNRLVMGRLTVMDREGTRVHEEAMERISRAMAHLAGRMEG